MGTVQERQGVIPLPADRPSQAIVDVSENMRAKIYSMFCKLGEFLLIYGVLHEYTDVVKFPKRICFPLRSGFNAVPGLSTVDYVTVAIIEKYLDFKVRMDTF